MAPPTRRTAGTESSRKVLRTLLAFSEQRPTATAEDLAQAVGVPLSSAYRYISLLREVGLIEEGVERTYHVSARVIPLARAAQQANGLDEIIQPVLRRLARDSGEAALVVRRFDDMAVCVNRVESSHPIRLSFEVGHPMPLRCGAAAKVLLAAMPAEERADYLDRVAASDAEFARQRTSFEAELATIADRGWSESSAVVDRGIWAAAAPISDGENVVAALTVAGLAYLIDDAGRARIIELVRAAAADISGSLAKMRT
jgi:DNA-binding IclR family transcriptional regulator